MNGNGDGLASVEPIKADWETNHSKNHNIVLCKHTYIL